MEAVTAITIGLEYLKKQWWETPDLPFPSEKDVQDYINHHYDEEPTESVGSYNMQLIDILMVVFDLEDSLAEHLVETKYEIEVCDAWASEDPTIEMAFKIWEWAFKK